ncbi:MAG: hypothetical protein CMG66_01390 [Candidatus Marinimicrobia bacterium]|nr:hypothetical protein [Candidatus Neomarinimicrobiota bacterium]|tara:strand:+ start:2847 stop:5480 length:2634 start_codon:yes stop_codon:yes gene_type:complete
MYLNVKSFLKSTPFVILLLLLAYFFIPIKDKRQQYETFLSEEYNMIPSYSSEELKNIPKPEHPHMATFQNKFMTIDPELGYVPSERLYRAFLEKQIIDIENNDRSIAWQNIPTNMGGRTRTIMFDPNDPTYSKVWAAGVSGGLWYNNNIHDESSRWQPVDDFWDNLSVSKITFDPNNTEIFYVSTGEANTAITTYRESSSRGVGIWKSLNGGQSWELLESTYEFEYITDIEVKNRNNLSELYACVVSGTYQGEEHESLPSDGLYRSIDYGISWEQLLPNIPGENKPYSPSDIEITSSGKIFIGTMKNLDGEGGATILTSNTGDLGTWHTNSDYKNEIESSNGNNIPGRVILSSSLLNPEYVYATIGAGFLNNMGFNLSYGEFIIRTTDSGNSWNYVNIPTASPNEWASLAWHALAISVHPENPNIIFAGGLELYKSNDGGNTWTDLSEWDLMYSNGGDRYVHADIHQIVFQPNNPNTILVTTDGGVFYSNTSHLPEYEPIFIERNQGYNTLQFYTCDISPNLEFVEVVGGLQDNGTLYFKIENEGESLDISNMITGGDGAYCFFDDNDPLLLTSTYYNAWYQFNYSTNEFNYENNNSGVFINPSDYDSDNNILYANKIRFNGGQNNRIIKIEEDFDASTIQLNTNTSIYFSALKLSHLNNNEKKLFLGTQSGRLYKVNNINSSTNAIEITNQSFPTANISSIDISNNGNEILVTFSNYGVSSVWYSLDGGLSWLEKENNLPDMPVRWGTLHPDDNNYALLATEIGVWETNNLQENNPTWFPSSNGLGNVRVDMLSIRSDNMILAASHGRGLFYGMFNADNPILGDLNFDNFINVLDVVLLVNLILDSSTYNNTGDINNDMTIDVLDVVSLLNIIFEN